MPTPADALAALRDGGRWTSDRHSRSVLIRLDSGITVEVPGPRVLAVTFVGPWLAERGLETFRPRTGSALLMRRAGSTAKPEPADLKGLRRALAGDLAALPARPDSGRPYKDLAPFVTYATPARVEGYLDDALAIARRNAPVWRTPSPARPAPRTPPLSAAERLRQYRSEVRARADETGREWLETVLGDGDLLPGERITAADLWARAHEDFLDFDGATDDDGNLARTPGRSRFYTLADEILGPRRTVRGVRVYLIPTRPEGGPYA